MRPATRARPPHPAKPGAGWTLGGSRLALALLLVGGLVAAVHWPVLGARALALDDDVFVTYNPLVTRPGLDSARRFFVEVLEPSTIHAYYLPLSMTSLMVDYALGGRANDPRVFHRTNLALHVLASQLVLLILHRLFGALVPAALGALLFGLHPLAVEPIASIGERKTLLATSFAFASILAYLGSPDGRRRAWRVASVVLYLLALLSKPSVTALPVLLLVLDFWPLRRLSWRAVVEKWPYLLLSLLSGAITILSVARTWDFGPLPQTSVMHSALRVCYVLVFYLGKMVWPGSLSPVYQPPEPFTVGNPAVAFAALAVVAVTSFALMVVRSTRAPLAGWAFFVAALAPTFGILAWSAVIAYDRYVYFPALGVLLVLVAGLARAWTSAARRGAAGRILVLAPGILLLAAGAWGTRATLRNWRDSLTLARHIVAVAPGMAESHNGLGVALEARGEHDAAIAEFRRAIALNPGYPFAHQNLGSGLLRRGEVAEALDHLRRARTGLPGDPQAAYAYGVALIRAGRLNEAEAELRRAVELRPGYVEAMGRLATVLALTGRVEESVAALERAIGIAPANAHPRFWLGMVLLEAGGREREALARFEEAVRLDPEWPDPLNQLAWLLATLPDPALRDPDEARRHAEKAVELTGRRDAGALDTWAAAEAAAGRFEDAVRLANDAAGVATGSGADSLADAIRARLTLYRRGQAYTETPGKSGS